ncbi:TPA: hypothetical protein N2907_001686 [Vibrio parahaemolyticus]|nr:hypothetical protein [Vibrio parahaemolyticus]HCH2585473.1 hypothetical protein [Vibrio parahaemolyticus]HCM1319407.1 hypothetical protein [Vibrio parahaemolyticus]
MLGYQFVHYEGYAREPSRNNKKQSARSVALEAERAEGYCSHVYKPQSYIQLYGVSPSKAVEIAEDRAKKGTDTLGRKIRRDAQIIIAGVASYPIRASICNIKDKGFVEWLNLNHRFLKETWGSRYISNVLHIDEEYFHIHFYIVPELDENGFFNVSQIHHGISSRDRIKDRPLKEKNRAYKMAMIEFQNSYYEAVGIPTGLTRLGASSRRLTRKEWMQEKNQSMLIKQNYAKNKLIEIENSRLRKKIMFQNRRDSRGSNYEL